ncbi:unnamed protein product [Leptosia nina]|uniref:Carboxylesterase type B domain-containing protein n=1 Tax=Leptosia nina TaxID=320188 RepID=A0AAV1JE60_9NEOP
MIGGSWISLGRLSRRGRKTFESGSAKYIHKNVDAQVSVAQGKMKGRACVTASGNKYYSFEGIPYARPPIGPLRFREPQQGESWSGILDATKPGNKCWQMTSPKHPAEGSEDCLYLNIYTPSLPSEKLQKLPVLFYLHGGRAIMGYSHYYRPDYFIPHDVIVVTANYRLNVFGFLCLDTPEVPGNAGIKDVVMAMKWVKDNIENFNGDSNNIVAFGESAGASIVMSLFDSEANGVFSKMIALSGTGLSDFYIGYSDPLNKAKEIVSNLGESISGRKEMYDKLLKTPAEALLGACMKSEFGRDPTTVCAFLQPVVEKKFEGVVPAITENPVHSFKSKHFNVPILMTMSSHEGALFVNRDRSGNILFNKNLRKYIPLFTLLDQESQEAYEIERRLNEIYFQNKEIGPSALEEYLNLLSDVYINRDILYTAELLAKREDNFYFCRFAYAGNMNLRVMRSMGVKGATHGDILQYLFYKENKVCDEKDKKIVNMLCESLCNFAKTGKPTWTNQEVEWLPYRKNEELCLNVSENSVECCPEPQHGESWAGILDATKPGNKCWQMTSPKHPAEGSEDCLYLNIYTPSLPSEQLQKLPVLFYLHGGRAIMGYSHYYRPDYFIPHDVIVVTANYRLNVFGFLCLDTPEVPGNAGIKDVVMAIKWVKDNIENFNGDSNNIVAFGESAGASIVMSLFDSEANGVFASESKSDESKVIALSGSALSDFYIGRNDPIQRAEEIVSNLGESVSGRKEIYDKLSNAPAEALLGACMKPEFSRDPTNICAFLQPVVEKKFDGVVPALPEYPVHSFRNKHFNVPILMSMSSHEGALFINRDRSGNIRFNKNLRKYIPISSLIDQESEEAYEIERRLNEIYFQNREIGPSVLEEYMNLLSDAYFNRDNLYTAELLSEREDNFYLCRFAYSGNMNLRIMKTLGVKGATHGDILQYLFYKENKMCDERDKKIVDMMCESLCNFAKTGKPTWKNQDVEWLPYRKNEELCLNVGENSVEFGPVPEKERNQFFLELLRKRTI